MASLNTGGQNTLNTDSWAIQVGNKTLLASWRNNHMGDTVVIHWQKFKPTDTLFAQRYLCGYRATNSVITMTIKNQQDEVIRTARNKSNQMGFTAKMPISEIFVTSHFSNGEILSVFFSIESKSEKINQTVLLGRLKPK